MTRSLMGQPQVEGQTRDGEEQALHQKPGLGLGGHHLSHHPIGPEGEAEGQGNDRQVTEGRGLQGHADHGQTHGDRADPVDPLMKKQGPGGHVQQGGNVIAQAGLHDLVGIDRLDEDDPVGPDQDC